MGTLARGRRYDGTVKPVEASGQAIYLLGTTGARTVGVLHGGRENLYGFEYVDARGAKLVGARIKKGYDIMS